MAELFFPDNECSCEWTFTESVVKISEFQGAYNHTIFRSVFIFIYSPFKIKDVCTIDFVCESKW